MAAVKELPENYELVLEIDLKNNKVQAQKVSLLSLTIFVVMFIAMSIFVPITSFFDLSEGTFKPFLKIVVLAVGMFLYIVLHELVHAVFMKAYGAKKVNFGVKGIYAYAGSKEYFSKGSYLFIAIAPVLILGVILLAVNFLVPYDYVWFVYFIQLTNVSGAAGDLFVFFTFLKLDKSILIQDTGVEMKVYAKEKEPN